MENQFSYFGELAPTDGSLTGWETACLATLVIALGFIIVKYMK
ncbi:MAG: hypothetical protein NT007_09650 [Candidatus Kapabacteria bacterium]|nr:hypothetical protein [Candidatus Kapabacteria bacterium]